MLMAERGGRERCREEEEETGEGGKVASWKLLPPPPPHARMCTLYCMWEMQTNGLQKG